MTSYEMTTDIETMETIYSRIISVIVTGLKTIVWKTVCKYNFSPILQILGNYDFPRTSLLPPSNTYKIIMPDYSFIVYIYIKMPQNKKM